MKTLTLLATLTFFSLASPLAMATTPEEFGMSKKWLNLLYYEKTSSAYRSRVENVTFFIDRVNGPTDPIAEIHAEINEFSKIIPEGNQHPQCLFPSRYLVLRKEFKLAPPMNCPQLNEWTENYHPEGIVLIYASQYLSNPASAMGHTFLLIPSKVQKRGFWLTYNYAASIPENTGSIHYVWGGLTGDFLGDYSIMPLYQRLEQYGGIENRDLWFYTLDTTEEETKLFIAHLWELVHNAKFRYYFKDENCAGALLRTFAAIFDDLQDKNKLNFQVPPIETVKVIHQARRIKKIELIPSKTNVIRKFLNQVSSGDRDGILSAIFNPSDYHKTNDSSPYVSEGILYYLNDQRIRLGGELKPEQKTLEREAVRKRAAFKNQPLKIHSEEDFTLGPHLSHQPSQWSLGVLSQRNRDEHLEMRYRFTFHSLLDPDAGFLKNSGMELFALSISASKNSVHLKRFTIAQVQNFQPQLLFDYHFSWRVNVGVEEAFLNLEHPDPYFRLNSSGGFNWDLFGQYAYLFLSSDINLGGSRPESGWELGPELGTIFTFGSFKAYLNSSVQYGFFPIHPDEWHYRHGAELQWNFDVNHFLSASYRRESLSNLNLFSQQGVLRLGTQF